MSDSVWEVDSEGRYTYCAPQVEQILGYCPREIIGKTLFDFMPPDEAEKVGTLFGEICRRKDPIKNLGNWNIHKDGHLVLLSTSGVPLLNSSGDLIGYRGVDKDVTSNRQLQEELLISRNELEATLAAIPDLMFKLDKAGNRLQVYPSPY